MRLFSLCTFVRFETMIWPSLRFDISLQIFIRHFVTTNRKKTFQRIFCYNSGSVKESFERFSCLKFVFEKSKHREATLKHKPLSFMHQSIPAAPNPPPPPRANPRALALFLPWMANFRGWGLLSCQVPRGGDERGGQMPRPPSTLQIFSLIAQSNSVLSILMSDFLF